MVGFRKRALALALALWSGAASAYTDTKCANVICVSATVNGSSVEYVMQNKGNKIGWLAVGFGHYMHDSQMVIMWPNADGSVTLSQRTAPGHVMPRPDAKPVRAASLVESSTSLSGDLPRLAFSIPHDGAAAQHLVWAVSPFNPNSAAPDADIGYHLSGRGAFDLTFSAVATVPAATTDGAAHATTTAAAPPAATTKSSAEDDARKAAAQRKKDRKRLSAHERLIVGHAVFCAAAFMVLLPLGALLARLGRTFWPGWFAAHWVVQFALAAPTLALGLALGAKAVGKDGGPHLSSAHQQAGAALAALYGLQCALGAVIHFVKPKIARRPVQNYAHAVVGLALLAGGAAQVRSGYAGEWSAETGRSVPAWAGRAWWAWVVVVPLAYAAGLALLPRQWRQEAARRAGAGAQDEAEMEERRALVAPEDAEEKDDGTPAGHARGYSDVVFDAEREARR